MSYNSPFTGNVIQPTDVSYREITLTANLQLEWPINGTTTGDVAARIMEVLPDQAGWTIDMPPANQASVGQDALFRNIGSYSFTVADFDGNTIITVAAGESKYIYITDNPDEAGTWGIISFGVGSSSADAATLAGYGLKAITTTLNQSHEITTFSSDYSATTSDRAKVYVWTGGAGTLTFPTATSLGNDWFLMVRNSGTGSLAITPTGALINGVASIDLQPADSCFVCCSGSAYFTVGLGKVSQFNFTQLTKTVTGGTYTLTSGEAANVIQKYIGTLGSQATVNLPQTVQVYYVANQTIDPGPYDIVFTTGVSGAFTATVPAGNQVILVCDSVNIYNASTVAAGASVFSLSSGTVSNPSLNFAAETTTGMYRPGSGQIGFSILGAAVLALNAAGISITGDITATGNIDATGDITATGNVSATGTGNFEGGITGGAF
jgi:hypothetical protein